mgnify:CR=1 FL=1
MALELPALPYAYDALAPYMSKETLEFHHDKHHMAYVTNGNNLLKDSPHAGKSIEDICKVAFAEKIAGLVNNVGQHYNHIHFWNWMKPNGGGKKIPGKLAAAIDSDLGGYDKMRAAEGTNHEHIGLRRNRNDVSNNVAAARSSDEFFEQTLQGRIGW